MHAYIVLKTGKSHEVLILMLHVQNHLAMFNNFSSFAVVSRYYNLAHAVNERVVRQPSMLRAGTLRDYQLVGCNIGYFHSVDFAFCLLGVGLSSLLTIVFCRLGCNGCFPCTITN